MKGNGNDQSNRRRPCGGQATQGGRGGLQAEGDGVQTDRPPYFGGADLRHAGAVLLSGRFFRRGNHENGQEIPMYHMEKAVGRDSYEMYLSGSLSVITIENPHVTTDKELVIFRDSFGSSLAPLLVEGYQKITILDARYLNEAMIEKFVEFDTQDVLFIHSTGVINNETAFNFSKQNYN